MVKSILGSARANLLRTVVFCAVAPILGAVAVRALTENPDLSGSQSYKTYEPIVMEDLRYIVWRGSGVKDCAALSLYRDLRDQNPDRQLMAKAIAAFGEPECGQSNMLALKQAAEYARSVGRKPEADIFDQLAQKTFKPQFGKTDIAAELKVPAKAKAMVLGETTIVLKPGMRQSILDLGTSAVAVRVATQDEDTSLREWLLKSPDHRAILFHSGLYPFAQKLFEDFPTQVTFGDLHPKFTE